MFHLNTTILRLRIVFRLLNKGASIPFHHQQLLTTFIKKVLADAGTDYEKYEYNFSGLKGQTNISRNGLHYMSRRVTLVLSGLDEDFLKSFLRQLFKYDLINVGNLILIPEAVEKEQTPVFSEVSKFICISPLVIMNCEDMEKNKSFIHPSTEPFSEHLFGEMRRRMLLEGRYADKADELLEKPQLIADRKYLNKIYKEEKKFARIYSTRCKERYTEIRGYTFPFSLYGPVGLQEFVFTCGFGALTKNGFGMLDLAYSDPNTRTEEYVFA